MKMLLAVALGGAVGAVARYKAVGLVTHLAGHGFPWGTMAVNIAGSFLMGLLIELGALKLNFSQETRAFIVFGLLGGFTTFSSFSLDVATLWHRGATLAAGAYVASSVGLSILALFLGLAVVRMAVA